MKLSFSKIFLISVYLADDPKTLLGKFKEVRVKLGKANHNQLNVLVKTYYFLDDFYAKNLRDHSIFSGGIGH